MSQLKTSILYAVIALNFCGSSAKFNCDKDFECKLDNPPLQCGKFTLENVMPLHNDSMELSRRLAEFEDQIKMFLDILKEQQIKSLSTVAIQNEYLQTRIFIIFQVFFILLMMCRISMQNPFTKPDPEESVPERSDPEGPAESQV